MWSSVSGLLVHGEKMNVIGNNIANVNTLGFKGQRMDFQDFFYQNGFSAAGPTQIGRGASVNAVLGDFSQGSFEMTNDPMDLAIGGKGYFQVKDPYSDQVWYTRAGNFRFDNEGYLKNPQGYTLQGWKIDNSSNPVIATGANPTINTVSPVQGTGVPTDIVLDTWTVPPKQTTKVSLTLNLTADAGYDKTSSTTTPFFALSERWNGTQPPTPAGSPPLSSDAAAYQTSLKVYDEGGSAHTLTTYFDQVSSDAVDGLPPGYRVYEYVVTMPPGEDKRTFGGAYDPLTGLLTGATDFSTTKAAGILMKGTITFNGSGQIVNQTAYTYMGNTAYGEDQVPANDPTAANSWQPAAVSSNGLPVFSANFSGYPLANSSRQKASDDKPDASKGLIEFDLGFKCTGDLNDPWGAGAPVAPGAASPSIADVVVAPPAKSNYGNLTNMVSGKATPGGTTNNGGSSVTQASIQDGYASGSLTNTNVDQDGVLYGIYSNGVTLPLYQLTLYDFMDPQGLRREGGNLFSATRQSGNPQIGPANQAGMGNINAYNIEQSNVDMSREFVQMIITQRGFQANSKGITTVDTMLEQVINMKR